MVWCHTKGRWRGASDRQAARGSAARSSEKGQLPHHELTASACMFMHIVGLALPYTSFSMTSPPHYEKPKRWRALIGFKRVVGHSFRAFCILLSVAQTARLSPSGGMADTEVSKTSGGNLVRVRPSPRAPNIRPTPHMRGRPFCCREVCFRRRRDGRAHSQRRHRRRRGEQAHGWRKHRRRSGRARG